MFKFNTSVLDSTALSNSLMQDYTEAGDETNSKNDTTATIMKRTNLGVDLKNISLKPPVRIDIRPSEEIEDPELALIERMAEEELYTYEHLNVEQKVIYDYVMANPTDIITIQAGPGCGKSFVLKTIAYNIKNYSKQVIIFKHDLLRSFIHCGTMLTVAKFIMMTLNIGYFDYKALDRQISMNITSNEFMLSIIALVKKSELKNVTCAILFMDEYTIISKPMLLVMLMVLEHHKVGTIICGDKNQLQNIHNSTHAILSSHTIAASFSAREFNLHINERCKDIEYNNFVSFFADFSSNRKLDSYAYAILSAVFMKQLVQLPEYNTIHLASTHQELANLMHTMVCNKKYDTDFYRIDQSRIQDKPHAVLQNTLATVEYLASARKNNSVPVPGKFLPYLPLVIGARYYVCKHSDYSQGVLIEYRRDEGIIKMLLDNGTVKEYSRMNATKVIFEEHTEYLLRSIDTGRNVFGSIYGFPIYPANFMSIHKCQGCTIRGDLDLILNKTTFQGLYVALSRVTSPTQIRRITIPNQVSHLVSTIVNFPEHCDIAGGQLKIDLIKERMINYKYYQIDNNNLHRISELCLDFVLANSTEARIELRKQIIQFLDGRIKLDILKVSMVNEPCDYNLLTISRIIKYRDVFRALSTLNVLDYNVWLHEFILACPDMSLFLQSNDKNKEPVINKRHMITYNCDSKSTLTKLCDWSKCYSMDVATTAYIKHFAKTNVHIEREEIDKSLQLHCIENPSDLVFLETTEFCCKVYRMYENDTKITMPWLINELNIMLMHAKLMNNYNLEPQKNKLTNAKSPGKIQFIKRSRTTCDDVESKVAKFE